MRKQLLTKMLLIAATLFVGTSAWATAVPYTVGTEGTGDAWASRKYSDAYEIAPGETYHFTFTNTSYGSNNWNNWLLDCKATADTSVDDWYFTMRSDNYGWGTSYNATMRYADFVWADFQTVMNGATVDMYVDYNSTDKIIRTYATISKSETTWHYNFASKAIDAESVFLLLSEELAVLNITTAEKVTSLPDATCGIYKRSFTDGYGYTWDISTSGPDYTGWSVITSGTKTLDLTDGLKTVIGNSSGSLKNSITPTIGNIINVDATFFLYGSAASTNVAFFRYGNIYIINDGVECQSRYLLNGDYSDSNKGTLFHSTSKGSTSIYRTTGITYRLQLEINTTTNTVTSMKVYVNGAGEASLNISDQSLVSYDYSNIEYGYIKYGRSNNNTTCKLTDIIITETPQAITTVDYTVKFQDALGNTLKDDVVHDNGVVGEVYQATATDMETFYNSVDESLATKKYVYKSGQNTSVVATSNAAENVITLVFDEYTKYTATASAVSGGSSLQSNIVSATAFADETAYLRLPKYIKVGGTWYVTETSNVLQTATEAGDTEVEYTVSDIDYFFEETDFSLSRSFAATITKNFFSRGNGGRLYANSYGMTEALEGGVYDLVIAGAINTQTPTMTYGYKLDDADYVVLGESPSFSNGSFEATKTVRNVVIPDGARFCWINNTAYNSNLYIDYVTLTKVESAPVTVTAAGYATYVPSYDLDFTGKTIEAYKVKVSEKGKAILTKVDNVPAGTPVLLYKEGGETEDIPVMTGAAAVTENDLVAGTGAAVATIDDDYTNMILNNGSKGIGFYFAAGQTVAANRAYLHIATTLAPDAANSRMSMVFDGETTGISNVKSVTATDGQAYNLAGQRVAQPTKGLYIVNGKKIIIK